MTIWQAVALGALQGLTEFLPVSSSGHLVIGQYFLGLREPELIFDVAVHFATMIAVIIHFRQDIGKLWSSLFKRSELEGRRTVLIIIIGTIPAAIVGLFFGDFFAGLFSSAKFAAWMLLVTGGILMSTLIPSRGTKRMFGLKWYDALIVGIAQALAILPGISRSGATIVTSLHINFRKNDAAKFSFLLSLPAILGASVIQLRDVASINAEFIVPMIIGMITAGFTGYLAVALMLKIVNRGRLFYFAPYCFIVGVITLFSL